MILSLKRKLRRRTLTIINELLRSRFPRYLVRRKEHELRKREPELELVPMLCEPELATADVGALWGGFASVLVRVSRHCYIFEPNPRQAAFLATAFDGRNAIVINRALSNDSGTTNLRIPTATPGHATIEAQNTLPGEQYTICTVERSSLDEIACDPLGFVKIDVEGHERAVLFGMKHIIVRDRPNMLIEMSDTYNGGNSQAIMTWLREKGYCSFLTRGFTLLRLETYEEGLRFFEAEKSEGCTRAHNFLFIHEERIDRVFSRLGIPRESLPRVS